MGIFRVILALCVVDAHFPGFLPVKLFSGKTSVEIFFMISGFYMALAWPKYSRPRPFYKSRLTRILPPYYAVLFLSIIAFIASGILVGEWGYLRVFFSDGKFVGLTTAGWFAYLTNFTLIFQDVTLFFNTTSIARQEHLPLYLNLILPVSWTIALELYFYALVPWLSTFSNRKLLCLMSASFLLKMTAATFLGLNHDPWDYRFFPFELCLFLAGFLTYRIYSPMHNIFSDWIHANKSVFIVSCCILFAAMATLLKIVPPLCDTAVIIVILVFLLPLLFAATKDSKLDRLLGELSYPIYLLHIPVGWLVIGLLKRTNWSQSSGPFLTGTITIFASIALAHLVLLPLEKFRLRLKN